MSFYLVSKDWKCISSQTSFSFINTCTCFPYPIVTYVRMCIWLIIPWIDPPPQSKKAACSCMSPDTEFISLAVTHYSVVIMSTMASQITSPTIVYFTVYSGADQRKYQSSTSLAFVRGIRRWPGNSPHKGPVTRKMFPFDDVIVQMSSRRMTVIQLMDGKLLFIISSQVKSNERGWFLISANK